MLSKFFRREAPQWWCKRSAVVLAGCWCFGLLLGIMAADAAGDTLISLMRRTVGCPVSIVRLLLVILLPFLLSALAVFFQEPWLILPISFVKAFSFGFCAFGINLAFGQSGWLVRFLFLFSDVFVLPIIYLFWLRYIGGNRPCRHWEYGIFSAWMLIVGILDYCWISPFLTILI